MTPVPLGDYDETSMSAPIRYGFLLRVPYNVCIGQEDSCNGEPTPARRGLQQKYNDGPARHTASKRNDGP